MRLAILAPNNKKAQKQCMEKEREGGEKVCVNNGQLYLRTPPHVAHANHLDQVTSANIVGRAFCARKHIGRVVKYGGGPYPIQGLSPPMKTCPPPHPQNFESPPTVTLVPPPI